MQQHPAVARLSVVFCLIAIASFAVRGAGDSGTRSSKSASHSSSSKASAKSSVHSSVRTRTHRYFAPYDPTKGDVVTTDDPAVRQAAIDALGHEKGSVLAVDPSDGRILTIVGQKMAYSAGFEPCSTIKPFIALAALKEGVITQDTMLPIAPRRYMDLTEALAHSNNKFFEEVGTRLGFQRVIQYDAMFGLGQKVGYNLPLEQPGSLPPSPPLFGGVARMSSFGEGIRITPFQLASLVSTLANGGTQYYLQYPQSEDELKNFEPRIRQQFDIAAIVPEIQQGMLAAVLYGTAQRSFDPYGEQALAKTGTCNDERLGGRLGWFVSYANQAHPKIVIVVLLHGGARIISGPHASEIGGRMYRTLSERNYFVEKANGSGSRERASMSADPAVADRSSSDSARAQ